jgi:hypothetical protein
MSESTSKRALVTGASAGLGEAFAERLARDGHDLILVARRRERLAAPAGRLRAAHGIAAEVLVADLAREEGLAAVERRVGEDPALALLVNNAGAGGYMALAELPPERLEELIRVQVLAVARLTRAALPGMIARGRGAVINVSSRLAFSASLPSPPLPRRATYVGCKAFVNAFTQLVAGELAGTGVRVQALCPGIMPTEFHRVMGMDPSRFPPAIVMAPEFVVEASLAGLARDEVVCLPGLADRGLLAQVDESQQRLLGRGAPGGGRRE